MKKNANWIWLLAGALYGLMMRFGFDFLDSASLGPMSLAFLIATPLVVGAISVYGLKDESPPIANMLFFPWLAILFMMLGAAVTLLEGSICIAIMSPLFLGASSVGGLIMGLSLRWFKGKDKKLLSITLFPFALFMGEEYIELPEDNLEIIQTVVVQATPATIWGEILSAKAIQPEELPLSIVHLIGVPKPLEGINVELNGEEIRFSIWEKGVNFRAKVTEKEDLHYIKWRYIFDSHSFPEGSMDEHVAIGGQYFDLQDTSFKLVPLDEKSTELTITAHYRISSSVNFYAVPVSKILGEDFIHTILTLYKKRSEQTEHGPLKQVSIISQYQQK